MREIKFRGMRKDNHQWVYGHYYEEAAPLQPIGKQEPGTPYIVFPAFADWNMPREMLRATVIPETIGQFTGLLDKNRKEVYEGDICQSSMGFRFVVIWDEDNARFLGQGIGKWREHISYVSKVPVVEVIGNIHENPELLEVTDQ